MSSSINYISCQRAPPTLSEWNAVGSRDGLEYSLLVAEPSIFSIEISRARRKHRLWAVRRGRFHAHLLGRQRGLAAGQGQDPVRSGRGFRERNAIPVRPGRAVRQDPPGATIPFAMQCAVRFE